MRVRGLELELKWKYGFGNQEHGNEHGSPEIQCALRRKKL